MSSPDAANAEAAAPPQPAGAAPLPADLLTRVRPGDVVLAARPATTRVGRNLVDRGGQLVAKIAGSARVRPDVASVEPILEINGDDPAAAAANRDLEFDGDVNITGSLRAGRQLRATGTVWVADVVESVRLRAGDSLHVGGGIIGKDSGECVVAHHVTCKFIAAGQVDAGGDINVRGEVAAARIACTGRLTAAGGPIFGGTVVANGGVACKSLGKPSGVPTVVGAGYDQALRTLIATRSAEIEANRKHVKMVREKLEPLLKNERALSRQQRERATELLWEAGELEKRTDTDAQALAGRCRAALVVAQPEIVVAEAVYPGVTVRFANVEAVITTELQGPLKLTPRTTGQVTHVVVIDQATGSERVLESQPVVDPAVPLLERFARETPSEANMRAKCIRAFVSATQDLFQTMVRMPLSLAKPRLKEAGERTYKFYKISAAIRLTGTLQGAVWISFSERVATTLASSLSGEKFTTLDTDATDALGEIANMIVGSAKRQLAEGPLGVSTPTLLPTEEVVYPVHAPVILLPFETAVGRFIIEIAIATGQSGALAA